MARRRTECGERLYRLLEQLGYVQGGRVETARVLARINRRLGPGRALRRSALDHVLLGGTELTVKLLVALADGLRVDVRRLLYDRAASKAPAQERDQVNPLALFDLDALQSERARRKGKPK